MKSIAATLALAVAFTAPASAGTKPPLAGDEIRTYLLNNPEVIIEALKAYEVKQKRERISRMQAAVAAAKAELYNDPDSPVMGNPNAGVTIVEFTDYRCPHCRTANAALRQVLAADPDVRIVVKEYPILGEQSEYAARFALAVYGLYGSEAYKRVHDALYTISGRAGQAWAEATADALGFDLERITARMASQAVTDEIEQVSRLAGAIGITGTPFLVIGDEVVPGAIGGEDIAKLIGQARQK